MRTLDMWATDWEIERPLSSPGRTGPGQLRPFSLAPLIETMGPHIPPLAVAARLGVGRRQIYRWRRTGLTTEQADVLALRLGLHPACVWPEWLTEAGHLT